jgi:hypothetical protein
LQGILDVWTTREASAHFDVDAEGNVGQYVRVNEYAWATGNTIGNQVSISIEMCNLTLSPDWQVAEVTWREAARLCGWLHARVIGTRPVRETCKVHHDWKATVCAGPYIDTVLDTMISDAQQWYDYFIAPIVAPEEPPPPPPDIPIAEPEPIPDPPPPPELWTPPATVATTITEVAQQVIDRLWGTVHERDPHLVSQGWDPVAVTTEVNRILSGDPTYRMVLHKYGN